MDPFTIASVVAKTTATCLSTTKYLYELQSKYSNAPIAIASICSESAVISTSLAQIQSLLLQRQDLRNAWASRTELADALDTALTGCMVLFSCLDSEVQDIIAHAPATNPERIRWRGRVRMVWNEQKLGELLVALRGQQTAINLLIQLLQMDTLNEIKQMIQANQGTIWASIHSTRSLRSKNPSVRIPASIYDGPDAESIFRAPFGDQASVIAPSEMEFDFDDDIINSRAYRKVLARAKEKMAMSPRTGEELGDLIDFSDASTTRQQGHAGQSEEELLSEVLHDLQGLLIGDPPSRKQTADSVKVERTEPVAQPAEVEETTPLVAEPEVMEASRTNETTVCIVQENTPMDKRLRRPRSQPSNQVRRCIKCGFRIPGQYVRATARPGGEEGLYHLDCFVCADCGVKVVNKFLPSDVGALCETDYFRRLGLLCYKCGKALRGQYITALDRKYHVDHFTCDWQSCSKLVVKDMSYYMWGSAIYCLLHYATQYAELCNGCNIPILKEYVEVNKPRSKAGIWHPQCYEIHNTWKVKVSDLISVPLARTELGWVLPSSSGQALEEDDLSSQIEAIESRACRVRDVLYKFEEKSAAYLSDMQLALTSQTWAGFCKNGTRFIGIISHLFESIILVAPEGTGTGRATLFCSTLFNFYALAYACFGDIQNQRAAQDELSTLITKLARCIKDLVCTGLQSASYKKPPRDERWGQGGEDQIDKYIDCIARFSETAASLWATRIQPYFDDPSFPVLDRDRCTTCHTRVESKCYASISGSSSRIAGNGGVLKIWHVECYACSGCGFRGAYDYKHDTAQFTKLPRVCLACGRVFVTDYQPEFVPVLRQHIYLLYVEHWRFVAVAKGDRHLDAREHSSISQ